MGGDIAFSGRNANPCALKGCMWPKTYGSVFIPISISQSYDWNERLIIIKALRSIMKNTCIRFFWRRKEQDFLHFFSGNGCWSYVGRQGGMQYISLKKVGCLYTGIVQHEVLHALGFNHEQSRSDRDHYITIIRRNLLQGMFRNFRKVNTNNLGTPYDYQSILHYGRFAFSKGQNLPTIVAKGNPNIKIGGATVMSNNDIKRVNRLYGCRR
ncbi:high choriolytic enzyme 2-like [Genypterus blacodes]|uniref:high choriolytic enzyme 2-like n=1 Tax=Genypterus blacodes TaxID=154954 RepID=UPI003F776A25